MCARVWIPTHSFVGPDARPDRGHVTRATGGFEELPEGKVCHMSGQRFGVEQKERVATGSHPSPPALEIKACVCVWGGMVDGRVIRAKKKKVQGWYSAGRRNEICDRVWTKRRPPTVLMKPAGQGEQSRNPGSPRSLKASLYKT